MQCPHCGGEHRHERRAMGSQNGLGRLSSRAWLLPHVRDPAGPETPVVTRWRWWSLRRRLADLRARIAALEAGRPPIVTWKPDLAARGRPRLQGCNTRSH